MSQLAQTLPATQGETVRDYVAAGLSELRALVDAYHQRTSSDLDDKGLKALEALQHQIEVEGGWNLDTRVRQLLDEMRLPGERLVSDLSGGWRRRVDIARTLVARPKLLLLDEPTNHLDLGTIEWLEGRVQSFTGAVLFVTHDRTFLQRLATRIVELDRGKLTSYPGSYERYLERKEEELEAEAREAAQFDKRLETEEAWIRQGIKARRTRNEGRVRALEAMRREFAERVSAEGKASINVESAERSGKKVIDAVEVSHCFGDEVLFEHLDLKIRRGDRVGLIGNNGVGKTTLVKILLGELEPTEGLVERGVRLEVAYFDPLRGDLDPDKTVAESVVDGGQFVKLGGTNRHVIGYLKGFLFSPERAAKKVAALSGGERNRLLLARLFARASNLLVLDEPTNDLDLETLEVLEEQLMDYDGTLLVVSHDRTFLDNVVTSTLVFEDIDGQVSVERHVGGYQDWARKGRVLATTGGGVERPRSKGIAPKAKPRGTSTKLSYKLKRELEALPQTIEALEAEVASLEAQAAAPEFYTHPFERVEPVLKELDAKKLELEKALERWVELEDMQKS